MASTLDLFDAMDAGDVERVREMLVADPTLASARDEHGISAILHARYRQDKALVAVVAELDPPLDVFDAAAAGDLDGLVRLGVGPPSTRLPRTVTCVDRAAPSSRRGSGRDQR
jgi:hypothetical protein